MSRHKLLEVDPGFDAHIFCAITMSRPRYALMSLQCAYVDQTKSIRTRVLAFESNGTLLEAVYSDTFVAC